MALLTKPNMQQVWASGGDIVEPSDLKKQQGWTVEVPPHQFENWIQNRQDEYLAHINQRGIPAWDGLTNYEAGGLSYVQGSDGKVYKSVAASGPSSVVSNPTTDGTDTYWTIAFADVGAFLTQATGDARYTQRSNNLSDLTNVVTARTNLGAAPVVSPAFTGTPTAPTASPGTNTTQLATTAFVLSQDARSLNSTRIDVESSATVDLTSSAPNTRHINITGGGTINGFTIAAGQCYFARFDAAGVLSDSAGLVTNRGANITVAPGDSCVIRATAANTVEIICGDFLIDRAVGSGQTLQNVAASRALTTNYTNTTGRTIFVSIGMSGTGTPSFDLMVDGLVASYSQLPGGPVNLNALQAPIPNGSVYSVQLRGGTFSSIRSWLEIR